MYRIEIEDAINDYLLDCGLDPDRFDVDIMSGVIKRDYPNIVTIYDIPSDRFTDMLISAIIAF